MDAALIIASGRTGKDTALEPMLEAGNLTAEQRLVLLLQEAGLKKIYVITHQEHHALEKSLARFGVSFLQNPEKDAEMIDNIRFALKEIPEDCRRVLITPNHIPCFSSKTVRKLLASRSDAAVASYQGKNGHPLLLKRRLWPALMNYQGPGGLAGAMRHLGLRPEPVEADDPGVLLTLDEQDEKVQAAIAEHEIGKLRPVLRVSLAKEEVFYGPGPQQLLSMVDESENFREACQKMGISYSKGWKMIEQAETALDCTLVERSKGGSERGSSRLSPEGRRLMQRYRAFEERSEEAVRKVFAELFTPSLSEDSEADRAAAEAGDPLKE